MNIQFITGPAGSGKSFQFRKMISEETRHFLKCAPTGIAATNIEGATLHSTFQIDINTYQVSKKWRDVEVLYIDEISMVGSSLFQAALKGVPNATDVIVFGDLAQLPPIKDEYFFHGIEDKIAINILTTQYRQKDDKSFTKALNNIRSGDAEYKDIRMINNGVIDVSDNQDATTLAFKNSTVDFINKREVNKLGETKMHKAIYYGSMRPNDCIADEELQVAPGARVIMLNNDFEKRWVNGTSAKVVIATSLEIHVEIDGKVYVLDKHQWTKQKPQEIDEKRRGELERELNDLSKNPTTSYKQQMYVQKRMGEINVALTTGIEYVIVGSCTQFPVKLSYALTVHKSQGLTLDKVNIIPDGFNISHGIGYVALSRARSLNTISLSKPLNLGHFKFDQRVERWVK